MTDMGAMFHPFRLSREEKGLFTRKRGDMAHHPHPQTRLRARDLTVILIATVIESQREGAPDRLDQEKTHQGRRRWHMSGFW
jgi:hypothetical protein